MFVFGGLVHLYYEMNGWTCGIFIFCNWCALLLVIVSVWVLFGVREAVFDFGFAVDWFVDL